MCSTTNVSSHFAIICILVVTNSENRHAHIYGIDLASPNELVAHNRDAESIAKHIGADSVIFQTLDDLTGVCAEISQENGRQGPNNFEVGVFCGNYITPVGDEYFQHLEMVRGEGRKLKVMESAREAVVNGFASSKDFQMAANGVELNPLGHVVPADNGEVSAEQPLNSQASRLGPSEGGTNQTFTNGENDSSESPSVRERMDISLHNFADYS